jgi:hypothetical protein
MFTLCMILRYGVRSSTMGGSWDEADPGKPAVLLHQRKQARERWQVNVKLGQ